MADPNVQPSPTQADASAQADASSLVTVVSGVMEAVTIIRDQLPTISSDLAEAVSNIETIAKVAKSGDVLTLVKELPAISADVKKHVADIKAAAGKFAAAMASIRDLVPSGQK